MQAPDLNTIDNPSNCVFIALSPELLTGEAISLFAPELLDEYISLQDYDEIRHILIKEWKVFLLKITGTFLSKITSIISPCVGHLHYFGLDK